MPDTFLRADDLAEALAAAGLRSAADLYALGGALVPGSRVLEVALAVAGTSGRFHLKRYHYATWGRSLGLLGRGTLGGTPPEIAEMRALAWLRAHDLPAARPVAAAATTRRGRLVTHALLTEHVEEADRLDVLLRGALRGDARRRRAVLAALATVLGRMHALGFGHRDAHARNVLVRRGDAGPVLLDCRRGGPLSRRRGAAWDLACLDADLEGHVPATDRWRALLAWAAAAGVTSPRAVARRVEGLAARVPRRT